MILNRSLEWPNIDVEVLSNQSCRAYKCSDEILCCAIRWLGLWDLIWPLDNECCTFMWNHWKRWKKKLAQYHYFRSDSVSHDWESTKFSPFWRFIWCYWSTTSFVYPIVNSKVNLLIILELDIEAMTHNNQFGWTNLFPWISNFVSNVKVFINFSSLSNAAQNVVDIEMYK